MKPQGTLRLLKKVNILLSLVTIITALIIIALPFRPEIEFQISSKINASSFTSSQITDEDIKNKVIDVSENKLVIKSIGVDGKVNEGKDKSALDKGIWRVPHSSTPDKGSNTVIIAHRFLYSSGPITFYHLDKLKKDDIFQVVWNKKIYEYKVFDILTVEPTDVSVEEPTKDSIVTLYTCTPLFTSSQRLVVRAKLIKTYG